MKMKSMLIVTNERRNEQKRTEEKQLALNKNFLHHFGHNFQTQSHEYDFFFYNTDATSILTVK